MGTYGQSRVLTYLLTQHFFACALHVIFAHYRDDEGVPRFEKLDEFWIIILHILFAPF